jgi:hypothetical protein
MTDSDKVQTFTGTATGFTTIVDIGDPIIVERGNTKLVFEAHNSSANALTAFHLLARTHQGADWQQVVTGAGWATTNKAVVNLVGAPVTLAGGAKAFGYVDLGPVQAIKFQATAGTAATLTIRGQLGG